MQRSVAVLVSEGDMVGARIASTRRACAYQVVECAAPSALVDVVRTLVGGETLVTG